MNFVIAIPSAKRCKSKNFKTLRLLRRLGVDMNQVFLFLDTTEINTYKENYVLDDIQIVGIDNKNIVSARNYIEKTHFTNNQKVLCLDDDINWLNYKNDEGEIKKITTREEFTTLFNKAFNLLETHNCSLFGVYPIGRNSLWFSKARTQVGNNHILACCSGIIVDKSIPLQNVELRIKEEYERGFLYGKNIRVGFIGLDTKYYCNDGIGIRTFEDQLDICNRIMQKYPNRYSKTPLKINNKKGNVDLRLNKKYYL